MQVDYRELIKRDNNAIECMWDFLAGKILDTPPFGAGLWQVIRRSNNWQNALNAQWRAYVGQGKNPSAQGAVKKLQIQIETADSVIAAILNGWVDGMREQHYGHPLDPYNGAFSLGKALKRVVLWRASSGYLGESG